MRKTFLLSLFSIILSCAYAQQKPKVDRDSLIANLVTRLENIEFMMPDAELFKLYKTENIYIFLKLNTATGQIDLLQWSLEEGKEFTVALNKEDLSLLAM